MNVNVARAGTRRDEISTFSVWVSNFGTQPGEILRHLDRHNRVAPMPTARPFDGFVEYTKRVSPALVHPERNRYSVPVSFANRPGAFGAIRIVSLLLQKA